MTEPTAGAYSRAAGAKIRAERMRQGLSLTQAVAKAAASGYFTRTPSAPAWRAWEAGERGMSLDVFMAVAKTLGVPHTSLLPDEPADAPLVLTEDWVDLLIAMGDALRAGRRNRYTLLTEDPGGTS